MVNRKWNWRSSVLLQWNFLNIPFNYMIFLVCPFLVLAILELLCGPELPQTHRISPTSASQVLRYEPVCTDFVHGFLSVALQSLPFVFVFTLSYMCLWATLGMLRIAPGPLDEQSVLITANQCIQYLLFFKIFKSLSCSLIINK